jgi:lipid-binding SYLF domain-containing protein
MRIHTVAALLALPLAAGLFTGCDTSPKPTTPEAVDNLSDQVSSTIKQYKDTDPTLDRFFNNAYGYAVFPAVRSAGVGVGGAYGRGEVYEKGKLVGYADLKAANVGATLGAQRYAEVIFFENEGALAAFKDPQYQFDAAASAVAASKGAGTAANYQKGVAVFTLPEAGLMFQASIGGQKFQFTPVNR